MKLLATELGKIEGVAHGFFTREGGVSEGIYGSLNCAFISGDNAEHVRENRARVAASLGISTRADALRQKATEEQRKNIDAALFLLTAGTEMGKLFKVLALTPTGSAIAPAGFE